jgi:hypothetical protein
LDIDLSSNSNADIPARKFIFQPAKTLVPSYYCLYSLYNKIRNKGKIVSAGS